MNATFEFSRPVEVLALKKEETEVEIAADAAECSALAKRLDLQALRDLKARLLLRPIAGSPLIRVRGRLTADVVQTCGVTLEPLPAHIDEEFERLFAPPDLVEEDPQDLLIEIEAEEPPDPFQEGIIDLGETVAEQLALALDPFPRKPGATLDLEPSEAEAEAAPDKTHRPFANLKEMLAKKGSSKA